MVNVNLTDAQRLIVGRKILAKKHLLFGKLPQNLTQSGRVEEWKKIYNDCVLNHGFSPGLDAMGLRNHTWPNMKKQALEKRKKKNQSGAEGGIEVQLTDAEDLTLEIIGKNSAQVVGIGVPDSSKPFVGQSARSNSLAVSQNAPNRVFSVSLNKGTSGRPVSVATSSMPLSVINRDSASTSELCSSASQGPGPSSSQMPCPRFSQISAKPNKISTKRQNIDRGAAIEEEIMELKKQKLQLDVENVRLLNKKLQLEIEEIEERRAFIDASFDDE